MPGIDWNRIGIGVLFLLAAIAAARESRLLNRWRWYSCSLAARRELRRNARRDARCFRGRHEWGWIEDGREDAPTRQACMRCGINRGT